jgi:photosystem II reaction center protein PsbP
VRIAAAGGLALCILLAGCGGSGTPAASSASTSASASGLTRHIDHDAGFQVDYPSTWHAYQPADPKVQYLVGPDDHDFVQVRVVSPLPASFGPGDLQAMKKISDALLSGQPINIVQESQITVSGLPGYQYVYTFKDPSGQIGVHIHVFLFQANRLITLVFQALPEAQLKALAKTYDAVLASFKVLPVVAASPTATPTR